MTTAMQNRSMQAKARRTVATRLRTMTGNPGDATSRNRRDSGSAWADLIDKKMNEVGARLSDKKAKTCGLATGHDEIDRVLQGIQKSDLIILAGRPSTGKTTMALSIVEKIALGIPTQAPRSVALFSLETKSNSVISRMLSHHARVSRLKLAAGTVDVEDYGKLQAAADVLRRAPIYVEDEACNINEICDRARELNRAYGIDFIVVDYLQLVNCAEFRTRGFLHERVAICQALKSMAKKMKIPVLVLSQLCRTSGASNDVSGLIDQLQSTGLVKVADIVLLLRSPARGDKIKKAGANRTAILDIVKNRHGPAGKVHSYLDHGAL